MFNKNDPLIGAVQEVMKRNQLERDAAKAVNEKFGIHDRKALPHEKQGAWDAAYKQVLSEGAEALSPKQKKLAAIAGNPKKIDAPDLAAARKGHASHIEEEQIDEVLDTPKKRLKYGAKAIGSYVKSSLTDDKNTERKRLAGNKLYAKKVKKAHEKMEEETVEEGSDVTSPSSMGIKKPDYASGTPDYAKPKEQTVNRSAKTSLPAGTVKKAMNEEQLEEKAVSKAQHRFFGLVRGIQKGKTHGSAKAENAAKSMSAKSVKDYAKTKEKGLPEKVSEQSNTIVTGMKSPEPSVGGAANQGQIKGQSTYGRSAPEGGAGKPAMSSAAANLGRTSQRDTTSAAAAPAKPASAAPASAVARPVPAAAKPAPKTNPAIQRMNAGSGRPAAGIGPGNKPAPAAAKPAAPAVKPNDTGRAGVPGTGNRLAKPAAPAAAKPAASKPVAKPAASKPVAKPAAKAPRPAAAKPMRPSVGKKPGGSRPQTRTQRDSAVVGPGGRLG